MHSVRLSVWQTVFYFRVAKLRARLLTRVWWGFLYEGVYTAIFEIVIFTEY